MRWGNLGDIAACVVNHAAGVVQAEVRTARRSDPGGAGRANKCCYRATYRVGTRWTHIREIGLSSAGAVSLLQRSTLVQSNLEGERIGVAVIVVVAVNRGSAEIKYGTGPGTRTSSAVVHKDDTVGDLHVAVVVEVAPGTCPTAEARIR